jgi:hypothetical protein
MACAAATLLSCGYHTGGTADLMPKSMQTIAIPPFQSLSTRYKLSDELPLAIAREFSTRTRFRVVQNAADADAVLNGRINTVGVYPQVLDPASGKATSVQLSVALTITLVQKNTGKVLYSKTNWTVRQNYEISVYPQQYFDESGPAMQRLSRDVARDVVSGIVEDF